MSTINQYARSYIEENSKLISQNWQATIQSLTLTHLLEKINPYLLLIQPNKCIPTIVGELIDQVLLSSEEIIVCKGLDGLAIFINQKVFGGWRSKITGIDLEFDHEGTRYIVTIKSGPNWGNGSQIAKMKADFISAKKTLQTSNHKLNITAVNGCCYGQDETPDKGDYYKYCGQRFWTLISGEETLYTDIVEPLGNAARQRNLKFVESYAKIKNRFVLEFGQRFCSKDGSIDWMKLVKFNSGNCE